MNFQTERTGRFQPLPPQFGGVCFDGRGKFRQNLAAQPGKPFPVPDGPGCVQFKMVIRLALQGGEDGTGQVKIDFTAAASGGFEFFQQPEKNRMAFCRNFRNRFPVAAQGDPQQRVVIKQHCRAHPEFIAVRQTVISLHRGDAGDQAVVRRGNGFETPGDPCVVRLGVIDAFRREREPGRSGFPMAEAAVIAPHGENQFTHSGLAAGVYAGRNCGTGFMVIVPEFGPGPDAGGDDGKPAELPVPLNEIGVMLLPVIVVVPVDQPDSGRNFPECLGGQNGVAVEPFRIVDLEIHVRPDHRFEAVFAADLRDPCEVAGKEPEAVGGAVEILMAAAAEIVGFVHADVNPAAAERLRPETDHLAKQIPGFRNVGQQHSGGIGDRLVGPVPFQNLLQVAEGLDAADQFNAEPPGCPVKLPEFLKRIAPAQVAEKRFAVKLIGVFGIEHHTVEAEQGKTAEQPFQPRKLRHEITGNIKHDRQ